MAPGDRRQSVRTRHPTTPEAGFTLIEVLVALAVFALVSLAGASLIETTIRIQRSTAGRAERLADIQRTLYLVTTDFEQLASGPQIAAGTVALTRVGTGGERMVRYWTDHDGFHRTADGSDHILLTGVGTVGWRFAKHGAWADVPFTAGDATRPQAAELTMQIVPGATGIGGPVRRVIELPAAP